MLLAFVHRSPTSREIEKLRLILSTYQDGTGMIYDKKRGITLPGWRDFERSVALAFNGEAQESKAIFDVLQLDPDNPNIHYGISCKMRSELKRVDKDGRVTIELSNSSGKFWDHLYTRGINQSNYRDQPDRVGQSLLDLVKQWHHDFEREQGKIVDLSRSFYLVLEWSRDGWYQLFHFALDLPRAEDLRWTCPVKQVSEGQQSSRRIIGDDGIGTLLEWYGESGGQLKYYPHEVNALWVSVRFRLEPLVNVSHGIIAKAASYFPELWTAANEKE